MGYDSITPAEAPSAIASVRTLAMFVQKAIHAPTVVESPAAITNPKAKATSDPVSTP